MTTALWIALAVLLWASGALFVVALGWMAARGEGPKPRKTHIRVPSVEGRMRDHVAPSGKVTRRDLRRAARDSRRVFRP